MMATSPLVGFPNDKDIPKTSNKNGKEKKLGEDLQGRECKTNSDPCKENAEHENVIHGGRGILPFELRV